MWLGLSEQVMNTELVGKYLAEVLIKRPRRRK
jgi:hypothetical protein